MSTLYLGLDPSRYGKKVVHFPLIQISPRAFTVENWDEVTHVIFTSRVAAQLFKFSLEEKAVIAVGRATAACLPRVDCIAKVETAEGVVAELDKFDFTDAYVFFPCSARSRPVIPDFLRQREIAHTVCPIYDTLPHCPGPLPPFDELVFTSPSTVEAFVQFFGSLPKNKRLTPIGPVTRKALEKFI